MSEDFATRMEKALNKVMESVLNTSGETSVSIMRQKLEDGDEKQVVTKRLYDSISWATDKAQSRNTGVAKNDDLVPKPTEKLTMNIGTQVPYAKYVEFGSKPIGQGNGTSAEPGKFRDKIYAWAEEKFGKSEETTEIAEKVIRDIALHGTDAHPFFMPSLMEIKAKINAIMSAQYKASFDKYFKPGVTIVTDSYIKMSAFVDRSNTRAE
jgi:hypothetical protein